MVAPYLKFEVILKTTTETRHNLYADPFPEMFELSQGAGIPAVKWHRP